MNIVFLMAGQDSDFEKRHNKSKYLEEMPDSKRTAIEEILSAYKNIGAKIHCVIKDGDAQKYKLDKIIKLIDPAINVISIKYQTKGALCTALMLAAYIDNNEELLLLNGNQMFNVDINKYIEIFQNYDGGLIAFNAVDPKYSFVKKSDSSMALEVSEKDPISRNALCGFYFFKKGSDFISTAKDVIRKDVNVNNNYYISSCYNELIIQNKNIFVSEIDEKLYKYF